MARPPAPPTRTATATEFKALGHPLRLQILRLCQHEAKTNQELARALGVRPATLLHHVRILAASGFLSAEEPRPGPRGPAIKPYRATGKSWTLTAEGFAPDAIFANQLAMIDAAREEFRAAGPGTALALVRLGLRLGSAASQDLHDRLWTIVSEYAERDDDPGGENIGLLVLLHGNRPQHTPAGM